MFWKLKKKKSKTWFVKNKNEICFCKKRKDEILLLKKSYLFCVKLENIWFVKKN